MSDAPSTDMTTSRWSEGPWRIGFGVALTLAMAVATFIQFALGALGPALTADLVLTRFQFGSLSTVFFTVGALASPFVGRLVDVVGGRRVMIALFSLDAVSFLAMAVSPSYLWLLAAVAVGGIAISACNPVTNQLVAVHIPRGGGQGTIMGVKQSGVQVGAVIAGVGLPVAAATMGWRAGIAMATVLAVGGALLSALILPRPEHRPQAPPGEPLSGAPPVPAVRWLIPYAFFMGAGVAAATAYVALFAHERLGFSQVRAGLVLALMGAVAVVARIVWAREAERAGRVVLPLALIGGIAVVSTVLLVVAETVGQPLLWVAAVGVGVSGSAWNSVAMLAIVRETDRRLAGRASGRVLSAFYVGLLASPVAFGAIVDATDSYRLAWGFVAILFLAGAVVTFAWYRARRLLA